MFNSIGIVCTIGPASQSPQMLLSLAKAGMSVARLNMSHGTMEEHQQRINTILQVNREHNQKIKILVDLEGYRLRIGTLSGNIPLIAGDTYRLISEKEVSGISGQYIPIEFEDDLRNIKPGMDIYIDDGMIHLRVTANNNGILSCRTIIPGIIKNHKGVNIPELALKPDIMTAKDIECIKFAAQNQVDWLAQSFVRNAQDIINVRRQMNTCGYNCTLIAKIENRDGINNVDSILEVADGILIARGDMGVSIPINQVPVVQKTIIRKCNKANKIDITATQMLESMTTNLRPTRAEVSDVANAVIDGSDYMMLSGETAVGTYPVETVTMMRSIIDYTYSNLIHVS